MNIKVIGSSSAGNSYLLDDGSHKLLLDCGLPIKDIQSACEFRVSSLDGCLISHEHLDHSKASKDLLKLACPIYSSRGTLGKLKLTGHRVRVVEHGKQYRIGGWIVQPFNIHHDAEEPLGFIVTSAETGEVVLFATDTFYMDTIFNGIYYFIIEANHDEAIIKQNVDDGVIAEGLKQRIRKSHLSLQTLIDYLKACDLSKCKQIYLIHLSDSNSDADKFKREIQKITGCEVYVC